MPDDLSGVHDTFHVSNLKKCLADASLHVPLNDIKIDKTLRFVEKPVEILDREVKSLKRSRIALVKVRWESKRGPEFTWEREDFMKTKYPELFVDRDNEIDTFVDLKLAIRQDLGFIPSDNVVLSSTYVGKILGADQLLVILCYRYQESGIGYWILSMTISGSGESEGFLDSSTQTSLRIHTTVESTLGIPVDTTATAITSTRAAVTSFATDVNPDLAVPSRPEGSERSDDSFYEPPTLDPSEVKRCVAPLAFFSALRTMYYDQLYTKFNVRAARQVCLGAEVRSCAEHELELKEKLRAKHAARGRLLEEKDLEILRLKSQLAEKEAEAAEVIRLRDQVSSLSGEKSALTAEVSVLKMIVTQKDHDISLLDSRAACL
ncbi:hypothetical protein Tco_0738654 [Tanacetum coccineum]